MKLTKKQIAEIKKENERKLKELADLKIIEKDERNIQVATR